MIIITKISIVLCAILLSGGALQLIYDNSSRKSQKEILAIAMNELEKEQIRAELRKEQEEKEEKEQQSRIFYLDFKITHGSAFGGFCATGNDGRKKHGFVALDEIMMYGKHPTGKEFTYYIEDQNIEICATDTPDELMVRSKGAKFEIRQNGQGRDEGSLVQSALIRRNILYYIILESKHEISIKAVKGC